MTAAIPAMIRPTREKRIRIISEKDRLAVDAEDLLERGHDLALGDIRLDAVQQRRHQVIAAARGRLQLLEAMPHARVVPPRLERLQPPHLTLPRLGTDAQGGHPPAYSVFARCNHHAE